MEQSNGETKLGQIPDTDWPAVTPIGSHYGLVTEECGISGVRLNSG